MKPSKRQLSIYLSAIAALVFVFPGWIWGQTAAQGSAAASKGSDRPWSIQVERIEPGDTEFAYSFQIATYESLLQELNKSKQFKHVFREGDRQASDAPDLLILKTTVVKYKAGSETKRAVTTFSGATTISVRSQLVARDGKVVFDRTLDGKVRFFGSNLRATHNLARNLAKLIEQSPLPASEQAAEVNAPAKLNADNSKAGQR